MSAHSDISITAAASEHIRNQLEQTQAQFLRLGVKESGCNGFMYMLDFLEAPGADDQCFEFNEGVRVCVRTKDLELVQGTEVDMITEGLNSALVFKNPRAVSYCGCGESFAVAVDDADASATADPATSNDLAATDLATNVGSN